jgi:tRNA(Ile)-lysidine synthase
MNSEPQRRASSARVHAPLPDLTQAILGSNLVPAGSHVLIGVSGGPDSLALLHALCRLGPDLELTLVAAHLDHGLRSESAAEAQYAAEQARAWGAAIAVERVDARRLARERGQSLEAAGRAARYDFFAAAAARFGCDRVAVGHTADDQVETVLLHLLRGAGLGGLAGMPASRPLGPGGSPPLLVRPLLSVPRSSILAYCHRHGLRPVQDPSNRSRRFTRNRIRLDLLPLLEAEYSPQVRRRLLDLAATARAEIGLRSELVAELLTAAARERPPHPVALDLATLQARPRALASEALRAAFALAAGPPLALGRAATGRLVALLEREGPPRAELLGGWWAERRDGTLVYHRPGKEPAAAWKPVALPVPGRAWLPGADCWLTAESVPPPAALPASPDTAFVDAACLRGGLTVRPAWPGARFQPLGMRGSKKLSDFFIDRKVPRETRAVRPVVVDAEKVVWVAGMAVDERVRLTAATRRAVRLHLGPGPD